MIDEMVFSENGSEDGLELDMKKQTIAMDIAQNGKIISNSDPRMSIFSKASTADTNGKSNQDN